MLRSGEGQESVEKAVQEVGIARGGFWKREGEESCERSGAHGGEIAEAAGEGAMTDGGGGVPIAAEVTAFQGEVGSNEELVTGGWLEDGAVVADAEADAFGRGGERTDAFDNR